MNRALFLDRDGVINIEKDYLYRIEDFEFIEGIFDLCRYFIKKDYLIVIVTNQSGIARKYYTEDDFLKLSKWMVSYFLKEGIKIEEVYHCPHHPDITGECLCRKPHPGMLINAATKFNIDLKSSIIIGDKERDIEAGINAGLTQSYLFDQHSKIEFSLSTKIIKSFNEIME